MRASRLRLKAAVTPAAVVVGGHQLAGVLLEVDADDQRAAAPEHACGNARAGAAPRRGVEVADGRAGEEAELARAARDDRRQRDGLGEIGDDAAARRGREARREPRRRLGQRARRDVDGHVGARRGSALEQQLGLEARAGAELDQHAARRRQRSTISRGVAARIAVSVRVG